MSKEKDPRRIERETAKYFGGWLVQKWERLQGNKRWMHHEWLNLGLLMDAALWKILNRKLLKTRRTDPNSWLSAVIIGKLFLSKQHYIVVMKASDFKDIHIGKPVEREERVERENSGDEFLGWVMGPHSTISRELADLYDDE